GRSPWAKRHPAPVRLRGRPGRHGRPQAVAGRVSEGVGAVPAYSERGLDRRRRFVDRREGGFRGGHPFRRLPERPGRLEAKRGFTGGRAGGSSGSAGGCPIQPIRGVPMEQHHRESIERFLEKYGHDQSFRAILLDGSIAHGFAKPDSDIDVLIVADEAEYERRKKEHRLAFSVWDVCTYEGGYVDCKVVSRSFMELVAERG